MITGVYFPSGVTGQTVNGTVDSDTPITGIYLSGYPTGAFTSFVSVGDGLNRAHFQVELGTVGTFPVTVNVYNSSGLVSTTTSVSVVSPGDALPSSPGPEWKRQFSQPTGAIDTNIIEEGVRGRSLIYDPTTPDGGFWMAMSRAFGTVDVDGPLTGKRIARFGADGVRMFSVPVPDEIFRRRMTTDEEGNLYIMSTYVTITAGATVTRVFSNPDGSTAFVRSFNQHDTYFARINADGTWGWVTQIANHYVSSSDNSTPRVFGVGEGRLAFAWSSRTTPLLSGFAQLRTSDGTPVGGSTTNLPLRGNNTAVPQFIQPRNGHIYIDVSVRTDWSLPEFPNLTFTTSSNTLTESGARWIFKFDRDTGAAVDYLPLVGYRDYTFYTQGANGIQYRFQPDAIYCSLSVNRTRTSFRVGNEIVDNPVPGQAFHIFAKIPYNLVNGSTVLSVHSETLANPVTSTNDAIHLHWRWDFIRPGVIALSTWAGEYVIRMEPSALPLSPYELFKARLYVGPIDGGLTQVGEVDLQRDPAINLDSTSRVNRSRAVPQAFNKIISRKTGGAFFIGQVSRATPSGFSSGSTTTLPVNIDFTPETASGGRLIAPPRPGMSSTEYPTYISTIGYNGEWGPSFTDPDFEIPDPEPLPDFPLFDFTDGGGLFPYDPFDPDPDPTSIPTAPTPTSIAAFAEDTVKEQRFSFTDADGDGFYDVEIATTAGGPWRTDGIVTADVSVTLDTDRDSGDLFVDATIVPTANWNGTYTFYSRVKKSSFPDSVYSPVATITGTVTPVDDPPSAPFPGRMPTVESGQPAIGNFQFVDPDGTSWTVGISSTKTGTYGSTLTLAGKGALTVTHTSTAKNFTVRFDQLEGGYTGRYQFWAKVTDNTSLSSEPVLITGVVSGANITVELQRVTRTTSGVTITPLVPFTSIIDLDVTEAIEGPGSATLVVSATELARRADLLAITAAELVDAGATEIVVSVNATPIFVGPVTGFRHDIKNDTVSIYCTGLLGYFEARAVEVYDLTFTGVEQSAIIWDLIEREQDKDYGALAITDGTVDTSENRTIVFDHQDTVASALYEIRDLLNGPEIWIDPDRVVRTALVRGQDRRGQIVFTPANTSRLELSTDWKVLANVVHVYGEETGAGMSNATSMARYGRMVRPIEADKITVYGTALELATKQVLNLKDLNEVLVLTHDANPERPFTVLDYSVGDAVTVEADTALGRIVADVRIVSRTIRLVRGTASSYEVELTVERVAPDGVIRGIRSDHNPDLVGQVYDALYRR